MLQLQEISQPLRKRPQMFYFWGLGFRISGLGLVRVQGIGFRARGLGFMGLRDEAGPYGAHLFRVMLQGYGGCRVVARVGGFNRFLALPTGGSQGIRDYHPST